MSTAPPRVPPRFVPTLTEVVQAPSGQSVAAPTSVPKPVPASVAPSTPGVEEKVSGTPLVRGGATGSFSAKALPAQPSPAARGISGDGKVGSVGAARSATTAPAPVSAAGVGVGALGSSSPAVASPAPVAFAKEARADVRPPARSLPEGTEEYMVHRVMQRVDVVLDQRLREAIATVVQEQTRSVLPRLREEIESVVRHAVYEAVADELASAHPDAPQG